MNAASWARRYRAQIRTAPYPRPKEQPMHTAHRRPQGVAA